MAMMTKYPGAENYPRCRFCEQVAVYYARTIDGRYRTPVCEQDHHVDLSLHFAITMKNHISRVAGYRLVEITTQDRKWAFITVQAWQLHKHPLYSPRLKVQVAAPTPAR